MIVADTNLIVYLLINGEHTALAEAIYRRDAAWFAPVLWRHEFASAISLYVRKQLLSIVDALDLERRAKQVVMSFGSPALRDVLELTSQSGCSSYDCEFIATARHQGVPLVTADAKLVKAFPQIALSLDGYLARQ